METTYAILYLLLGLFVVLFSRLITTTIHELGHAIPALLFTQKKVSIYVGSYGEEAHSWALKLGRFRAYFKWTITEWNLGVCVHAPVHHLGKNLLIILGGPLFSLLFGSALIGLIWWQGFSNSTVFLLAFLILSSLVDFLVNIIANDQPLRMFGGGLCYNDGYQLQKLWRTSRYPATYFDGLEKMEQGDFAAAYTAFRQVQKEGIKHREIYRLLAQCLEQSKDYEGVLKVMIESAQAFSLKPEDLALAARAYSKRGNYADAIHFYSKAIYIDFKNPQLLNARGTAYLQSGEYETAILDFKTAIAYYPQFAQAYNNLGLAYLRLLRLKEALAFMEQSKAMDPNNPFVYLHLGFYYEKINEAQNAQEHFKQAKALGIDHHGIDFYIEK